MPSSSGAALSDSRVTTKHAPRSSIRVPATVATLALLALTASVCYTMSGSVVDSEMDNEEQSLRKLSGFYLSVSKSSATVSTHMAPIVDEIPTPQPSKGEPVTADDLPKDHQTKATFSSTIRFVYMIQLPGPKLHNAYFLNAIADRDDSIFIVGTFASESLDLSTDTNKVFHLALDEASTWTTGRNDLYDYARQLEEQNPSWQVEYYAFADGDVSLQWAHEKYIVDFLAVEKFGTFDRRADVTEDDLADLAYKKNKDPLEFIHARLDVDRPAYASVQSRNYHHVGLAPCVTHFDGWLAWIHRTAAPVLLPYSADLDEDSWYSSQVIVNTLLAGLFNGYARSYNEVQVASSNVHAAYPRSTPFFTVMPVVKSRLPPHLHPCLPHGPDQVCYTAGICKPPLENYAGMLNKETALSCCERVADVMDTTVMNPCGDWNRKPIWMVSPKPGNCSAISPEAKFGCDTDDDQKKCARFLVDLSRKQKLQALAAVHSPFFGKFNGKV